MSGNKYADLPDIDTAPDVYETEDVFPTSKTVAGDSSDEEAAIPTRAALRTRNGEVNKEELDVSNLMTTEEAGKRFRKAEKRRDHRPRTHYAYPPSPTGSDSPVGSAPSRTVPLSRRLRALREELTALETELADPSNPLIQKEREEENVDPGELIRGLVDVRGRIEKIRKGKEGRGRLVGIVLGEGLGPDDISKKKTEHVDKMDNASQAKDPENKFSKQSLIDVDKRVGELEKLVGSSNAAFDESSPIPPPLLPMITRLNTQLTLLTQPRHIDSISRRLKLLLSDLDRTSASQHNHRRHPSQPNASPSSQIQEQLLPLLTRLGPFLPQIPHIVTRLRTLSALHTSAGSFQSTLDDLEQEQHKMRESLAGLEQAVQTVENNLDDNRSVVKANVAGLEARVHTLLSRLEDLVREETRP